jgi:hypothetical protein
MVGIPEMMQRGQPRMPQLEWIRSGISPIGDLLVDDRVIRQEARLPTGAVLRGNEAALRA